MNLGALFVIGSALWEVALPIRAMQSSGSTLSLQYIGKKYGDLAALDTINLEIKAGEFVTFLGPSGSGKSTTLDLIAGFSRPTDGKILMDGRPIDPLPPHRRNIGVVFQHYALFPHMSVAKNVGFPLRVRRVQSADYDRLIARALEMVKLTEFSRRYPRELSGGQQQRVALARALVFSPSLLLLDEPLSALDRKLREWLQIEMKRIHRATGSTFIYVTHDQEEALALSDRIAIFDRGRIRQVGTGQELYENPLSLFVAQFLGESNIFRGAKENCGSQTSFNIGGEVIYGDSPEGGTRIDILLVRPDKISLCKLSDRVPDQFNAVTGVVSDIIFLGPIAKYQVRLKEGTIVTARTSGRGAIFNVGDQVKAFWPVSASKLLAEDDSFERGTM